MTSHPGLSTYETMLLEQHQLEIGQFVSLFQLSFKKFSLLTSSTWITELWEFLERYDIELKSNDIVRLHGTRENDTPIMEAITAIGPIPTCKLKAFNRVRCHLKLLSMADIVTGDGKTICNQYCTEYPQSPKSKWEWHRECPCAQDFKVWNKYIRKLVDATQSLHTHLGAWITQSHQEISWFYSPATERIYQKIGSNWRTYKKADVATRSCQRFYYEHVEINAPFHIIPTTVSVINDDIIIGKDMYQDAAI